MRPLWATLTEECDNRDEHSRWVQCSARVFPYLPARRTRSPPVLQSGRTEQTKPGVFFQVIYSKYWRSSHSQSGGGGEQDQQMSGHQKEDRRLSPWQRPREHRLTELSGFDGTQPEPAAGQKLPRSLCVTSSCQKVTPQLLVGVVATGGKLQGVDVVNTNTFPQTVYSIKVCICFMSCSILLTRAIKLSNPASTLLHPSILNKHQLDVRDTGLSNQAEHPVGGV